jgi:hypothetical protein
MTSIELAAVVAALVGVLKTTFPTVVTGNKTVLVAALVGAVLGAGLGFFGIGASDIWAGVVVGLEAAGFVKVADRIAGTN